MFNRHHRKARLLFALSDVILLALAFEIAYQIRATLHIEHIFYLTAEVKALLLGGSIVAYLLIGDWLGLYDRLEAALTRVILQDTARQVALSSVVVVLLEYVLRLDLSRAFLSLYAAASLILLSLFRWKSGSLVGMIRREFGAPHYVMVIGTGDHAVRIGDLLERSSEFGVRLVGFFRTSAEDGSESCDTLTLRAQYKVYPIASLPDLLQRQIIDEIIFAVDTRELPDLEEIFLLCDEEGVRAHLAVGFFPSRKQLCSPGPARTGAAADVLAGTS